MTATVEPCSFWRGQRVLITGHTGFKGSWLALWLARCGANVVGYSLAPQERCLFREARLDREIETIVGDVRDSVSLSRAMKRSLPDVVFHLAAQALVVESYRVPAETFDINVLGTARVLEEIRGLDTVRVAVIVTSDKCYRPASPAIAHRENDAMGGVDPYSASKSCAELVVSSYRASFFSSGPPIVTVRAGNVIGGGDWANHRLVPDAMRALESRASLEVRNPDAVRPWQHVLEPLRGYMWAAEATQRAKLDVPSLNFGPGAHEEKSVRWILRYLQRSSEGRLHWHEGPPGSPETTVLRLDTSLAERRLGWRPWLTTEAALDLTYGWYSGTQQALSKTLRDISFYEALDDCSLPIL